LYQQYNVPRKVAQVWVARDLVLPLLDGLDEVKAEERAACVDAINTFRAEHEHGLSEMVVCSRIGDYEDLKARLRLRTAVVLQPLTLEQIDTHLKMFGTKLVLLRQLVQKRKDIQELATTPLMLGIMMVVYGDAAIKIGVQIGSKRRIEHLFDQYVRRMLARPEGIRVYLPPTSRQERNTRPVKYPPEQMRRWLGWLARQLQQHNQSVFYLEWMQPDWLPRTVEQMLVTRGVASLLGLSGGLAGWLSFWLLSELSVGPIIGLLTGIFGGLIVGYSREIEAVEILRWSWSGLRSMLVVGLIVGLIGGLISGLIFGLIDGLIFGLIVGLIFGLVGGLEQYQITTRKTLNEGMKRSLWSGLVGGLGGGLIFGLHYGWRAYLQHSILRFLLWRNGSTPQPWEYVRFLDYAAERVILRKVGGGYIFIHRMVLEWFAKQEN
ncbi:MAG: hypothetical protein ACT4QE_21410, partial [Anaerolineales bacterium]